MQRSFVNPWISPLVLATILGIGALVCWSVGFIWIESVASELFTTRTRGESLVVTLKGRVLLQTVNSYDRVTYRTLDGQPVESRGEPAADSVSLPVAPRPDVRVGPFQIVSFGETGDVPVYWYLVPDGYQDQRAYFVAFDAASKRRIGYIGAKGFRMDAPPREDRIPISNRSLAFRGILAARWWTMGVPDQPYDQEGGSSPVLLASRGKLLVVDLARRIVRELPLGGEVESVANYSEARLVDDEREAVHTLLPAVRLRDRILILDWDGTTRRTILIPEPLRDLDLSLYNTVEGDTILQHFTQANYAKSGLYFVNAEGQIADRKFIDIYHRTPGKQRGEAAVISMIVPVPLVFVAGAFVFEPLNDVESPDYATALGRSLYLFAPALAMTCGLALVLAAWCYRRHRRYEERGALVWAIYVLVTGPPGLIGYLLHRRWPLTERCSKCGAAVPRDREECLVCAAEFPAPAIEGIEIFA